MASTAGLIDEAKTKHLNAKVQPRLFEAAARRVGTTSQTAVIKAALAALATQDDLGPWLARQWGVLAGVDPVLLDTNVFINALAGVVPRYCRRCSPTSSRASSRR